MWKCKKCSSTDVEAKLWCKLNENNRVNHDDMSELSDCRENK